jgi:hypothetical protein
LVERICKEIFKGTDGTFHHGGSTDILVLGFIADNHKIKTIPRKYHNLQGIFIITSKLIN